MKNKNNFKRFVKGLDIERQTEKAFLVTIENEGSVWMPFSQVITDGSKIIGASDWIIKEKGLKNLVSKEKIEQPQISEVTKKPSEIKIERRMKIEDIAVIIGCKFWRNNDSARLYFTGSRKDLTVYWEIENYEHDDDGNFIYKGSILHHEYTTERVTEEWKRSQWELVEDQYALRDAMFRSLSYGFIDTFYRLKEIKHDSLEKQFFGIFSEFSEKFDNMPNLSVEEKDKKLVKFLASIQPEPEDDKPRVIKTISGTVIDKWNEIHISELKIKNETEIFKLEFSKFKVKNIQKDDNVIVTEYSDGDVTITKQSPDEAPF
jgi:hypothetical protein